jgi:ABC-type transport system substrate-binding protein
MLVKGNDTQLKAFEVYYLGRPSIEQITVTPYPSVRAAWAELLRGNLDMLPDVSNDALDSLQGSSNVAVFSFVRHYQYTITFGAGAKGLESPQVRRELNAAIDRRSLIHAALGGHGVPSTGPVPPQHWAFESSAPRLHFDATLARMLPARHLVFTCLVPADSEYERIALAVKQQLAAAGVDMRLQEVTQQEFADAVQKRNFEAALVDPISGPSLFRAYRQFYSKVPFAPKPRTSSLIDAALDRIRYAVSDDEYRAGVTAFQQAIVDDPPALFLAWGERARAVSRRFDVPAPENGRDVLATLRLWRPVAAPQLASRN